MKFLSTVTIGKYSYRICKKTVFVHDEYRYIDFFAVYGKNDQQLCSAFMSDKINDSIIVKGQFSFTQKYLEFREYYSSPSRDSVIKRFYPNKTGKLILLSLIEYKNGVEKITRY